jgi:NTE family protein
MSGLDRRRAVGIGTALLCALLSSGCVYRAINQPLEQVDLTRGYRPEDPSQHRESGRVLLALAFSGGGTRAAAFAYGVLEELRDTQITRDAEKARLLDEVDGISGVSGGSFTAAYYGLFGDRIFDEFEGRFLRRNVEGALVLRALVPWNFLALMTPALSRSIIAARYYDRHVFDHATFADLTEAKGPRININATDLTTGNRLTFTQEAFDVICSNLDPLPVAYATASSSAVPGVLSPLTLRNHAGTCGFEPPELLQEALDSRTKDPRRYHAAREMLPYLEGDRKKYIHLVDGGVADNLGMRVYLERAEALGGVEREAEEYGLGIPDHVVVISVNAATAPDPKLDLRAAAPGLAGTLSLIAGAQIQRMDFETLVLSEKSVAEWGKALSTPERPVTAHFVEVGFEQLEDPMDRDYFKHLPTSFALDDEQVDRLIEAGRKLLRDSPVFQEFLVLVR